jgi:hypothetical protein
VTWWLGAGRQRAGCDTPQPTLGPLRPPSLRFSLGLRLSLDHGPCLRLVPRADQKDPRGFDSFHPSFSAAQRPVAKGGNHQTGNTTLDMRREQLLVTNPQVTEGLVVAAISEPERVRSASIAPARSGLPAPHPPRIPGRPSPSWKVPLLADLGVWTSSDPAGVPVKCFPS